MAYTKRSAVTSQNYFKSGADVPRNTRKLYLVTRPPTLLAFQSSQTLLKTQCVAQALEQLRRSVRFIAQAKVNKRAPTNASLAHAHYTSPHAPNSGAEPTTSSPMQTLYTMDHYLSDS